MSNGLGGEMSEGIVFLSQRGAAGKVVVFQAVFGEELMSTSRVMTDPGLRGKVQRMGQRRGLHGFGETVGRVLCPGEGEGERGRR